MLWQSIPICGLIALKVLIKRPNFFLVSTSDTPLNKDELSYFGSKLQLVNDFSEINIDEFISKFDYFILPGWSNNAVNRIAKQAKKKHKVVIISSDNNKKNNLRQLFGSIYFRLVLRKYYDFAFVPGSSGRQLMNMFGFRNYEITENLYGAYEEIFKYKVPYNYRSNEFIYVGQLIKRKSFDILIEAFTEYLNKGGTWSLRIIGTGILENIIPKHKMIKYEGKQDSNNVSKFMNNAKFFILLSREEHWGVVVCEAAACGLPLILTKMVGSKNDLLNGNGFEITNLNDINDLSNLFLYIQNMPELDLLSYSSKSIANARKFNSLAFEKSIEFMTNQ